jgi:hypothetical protein
MITMKRTVVALLLIASLIASHIRFSTSFGPYRPGALLKAVGAAAVMFLHSVPAGGSDLVLEAAGVLADAAMGAIGGLATRLRLSAGGRPLGRAGMAPTAAASRKVAVSRLPDPVCGDLKRAYRP